MNLLKGKNRISLHLLVNRLGDDESRNFKQMGLQHEALDFDAMLSHYVDSLDGHMQKRSYGSICK